ncbi:hypothetical protein JTB14_037761 [Gonioctena quinquepunctata]|nr:hypothetical protein JTB14_037761 [Gonioctena quinquepunctata]
MEGGDGDGDKHRHEPQGHMRTGRQTAGMIPRETRTRQNHTMEEDMDTEAPRVEERGAHTRKEKEGMRLEERNAQGKNA